MADKAHLKRWNAYVESSERAGLTFEDLMLWNIKILAYGIGQMCDHVRAENLKLTHETIDSEVESYLAAHPSECCYTTH
jgi:hypothetical protein